MKDYNTINIELIKQIQTGNKEVWEELIKNNIGIINKRVNYFSKRTKYLTLKIYSRKQQLDYIRQP